MSSARGWCPNCEDRLAANVMAGNRELVMLVDVLAREKNVPRDIVFGALEMALASATKKKYTEDIDVRVQGTLGEPQLERLRRGVELEDGRAAFERIEPADPRARESANRWYRVTIKEGRNREVRRMFEAVGARVSRLLRVRYGLLELPRDLAPGQWREVANPVKLQKL